RRLPVTQALHSPQVKTAAGAFAKFLKTITLRQPVIPYISNLTGAWIKDTQCTDPDYWAAHTTQTVLFSTGIRELFKEPNTTIVEAGPGQSLGSCVLQHDSRPDGLLVLPSVPHEFDSRPGTEFLLESVARLWLSGTQLEWDKLHTGERRVRVPLPPYQFDRQRYWPDGRTCTDRDIEQDTEQVKKKSAVAEWLYVPVWQRRPLPIGERAAAKSSSTWLVFANATSLCASILSCLKDQGEQVVVVTAAERFESLTDGRFTINPAERRTYEELRDELSAKAIDVTRILHFWTANDHERDHVEEEQIGFFSLLYVIQTLAPARALKVDVISSRVQDVLGNERIIPERAMVLPLCRTAAQEYPGLQFRHIDVAQPLDQSLPIELLFKEMVRFTPGLSVAYRGCHRWLQDFAPVEMDSAQPLIKMNGTYVITGGLGRVGLIIAEYLWTDYRAKLLLISRTPLPHPREWSHCLETHDSTDLISHQILTLERLQKSECEFQVAHADVADEDAMDQILNETEARWGKINGVIHAAGVTDIKSMGGIDELTLERCQVHFRAKVEGARVLARLLPKHRPDFCVLMSSLSAVLGGLGMAAYGAANQYLSALVLRESRTSNIDWLSIDWDTWDVLRANIDATKAPSTLSDLVMTPEEGIEAFRLLLCAASLRHVVVSIGDLKVRSRQWVTMDSFELKEDVSANRVRHPRPALATPFVEPRSEVEKSVAAIWAEVLGVDQVGIHDSFFQLGGHSLLGIRLIGKIRAEFGVSIPVRQIFETPTVAQFADAILVKMAQFLEDEGAGERS